jgi:hypothetical protein
MTVNIYLSTQHNISEDMICNNTGENFKSCTVWKCDILVNGYKIQIFLTVTSKHDKRDIFDELNL